MNNNIYICFIFIFISCKNSNVDKHKYLAMSDFPTMRKMQAEYIIPSTIVAPTFFVIQAGYLCVYTLQKDTMIDLFSLPDLIHKKSFGTRGKGSDEFQTFPWPCKSTNDDLYIRGYTPLLIKQFTIDSDLKQINEFILKQYESFGPMHIVQDSLLIYLSMGNQNERKEQISIKKYNLDQKRETGKLLIPTSSPENSSIDPNRAGGFDVNDSFIVYSYLFRRQIDIYDVHDMKLVYRLGSNMNREPVISENFVENIPQYKEVIAGEKYFYVLYNKKGIKFNEFEPGSQTIEVFDYNGKAIIEYSFDDHISIFALDEKHNLLYAYDATKEDYILKYSLPESTFMMAKE